jgi:hypothetical protein
MPKNNDTPHTGSEHNKPEIIIETGHGKIIIDLEDLFAKGHHHPEHDPGEVVYYRIKVDDQHHEVKHRHSTVSAILALAGKDPAHFNLLQSKGKQGHTELVPLKEGETVDFSTPGIEKFVTVLKPVKIYSFTIDHKEYKTEKSHLTVREILVGFAQVDPVNKELATKQPGSGLHHYKNLDEVISLEHSPKFTLFDLTPGTVS